MHRFWDGILALALPGIDASVDKGLQAAELAVRCDESAFLDSQMFMPFNSESLDLAQSDSRERSIELLKTFLVRLDCVRTWLFASSQARNSFFASSKLR